MSSSDAKNSFCPTSFSHCSFASFSLSLETKLKQIYLFTTGKLTQLSSAFPEEFKFFVPKINVFVRDRNLRAPLLSAYLLSVLSLDISEDFKDFKNNTTQNKQTTTFFYKITTTLLDIGFYQFTSSNQPQPPVVQRADNLIRWIVCSDPADKMCARFSR